MINSGLAMRDPADVSRSERPQAPTGGWGLAALEHGAHLVHGPGESRPAGWGDRGEKVPDLMARAGLQPGEDLAAGVRERKHPVLAVVGADAAFNLETAVGRCEVHSVSE